MSFDSSSRSAYPEASWRLTVPAALIAGDQTVPLPASVYAERGRSFVAEM
jgi:hypothetical protein